MHGGFSLLSSRADSYFDPVAVIYNVGLFVLQLSGHSATGGKSGQEPTGRKSQVLDPLEPELQVVVSHRRGF